MQNLYLIQVWKHSKILFLFILFFIFGQFYFVHKKIHNFPFFVWDMYSKIEYWPDTITNNEIYINDTLFDITQFPISKIEIVQNTLSQYINLKENNYNDFELKNLEQKKSKLPNILYHQLENNIINTKENIDKYPTWLKYFLQKNIPNKTIRKIEIKTTKYKYKFNNFIKIDSKIII